MKTSGNELTVLLRKISWIAVGVCGFGVLVGAVLLAVEAPPGPAPAAVASKGRASMGSKRPSRYRTPKRSRFSLPSVPKTKTSRPPTVLDRRVEKGAARPDLARTKLGGLNRAKRPALAGGARPGRLSKEELEKRRDERRKRQVERLRKRIQTLEDRIASYKTDGTRTEAQVSRMERSLDRMRKRLKRMEEQQAP